MKILLPLAVIASCGFLDATTPEERGIEVNRDIYKVYNQDKSMLLAESLVEDHYSVEFGNLYQDAKVWWTDTQCPYMDSYAVVYEYRGGPAMCFHGIMFSCREIYVALSNINRETTCGTALLHEFGHCMHSKLKGDFDGNHSDDEFWGLVTHASAESCKRGW